MKVLITGASRGIGRAITEKFLACGHTAVGLDILPASIIHENYSHVQADVSAGELPGIPDVEILINNAGAQNSGRDIEINLKGSMRITETYAVPGVIKSVLFLASSSARSGAEFPEYAASKGGVVAYMKNTALRLAPFGVTVNSLSPGGVITSLNDHVMNTPELWNRIMELTPLKKWAAPAEIAEWAYFLTAVNRSMTAQDLLVDNGEDAKRVFIW